MTSNLRLFLLATFLVSLIAVIAAAAAPGGEILIYPGEQDFPLTGSIKHLNPRFPDVPPREGGSRGLCFQIQLMRFDYSLRPYVRFPEGGRLSIAARDNLHPTGQLFFSLSNSTHSLKLIRDNLGKNLQVRFVYAQRRKELASVDIPPFPSGWSDVELKWDQTGATLYRRGKKVAEVKLNTPFDPIKLNIAGWPVDELQLSGDGQFSLDWETGYAARVKLCSKPGAQIVPRIFGFDTHVISLDPGKRDCPMVQLINTGPEDRAATLSFDVKSEVTGQRHKWQQKVTVPARSESMIPIRFPFDLQSDIYHMTIESAETTPPLDTDKHFMYIKLRDEPAGPEKFGLHASNRTAGSWPDALPIHLDHNYVTWYMTQGPPYVRWWNGSWGMDPNLPPEQWSWRSDIDKAFYAGHTVLACVEGTPAMPWMRGKEYEKGIERRKLGGDYVGGASNFKLYRRYVRALAARYKGKIKFYEIHNEPNAVGYNYVKPEDYFETCKVVYEEIKAADPDVQIYGISGTSDFLGYMQEVFKLGAHKYMDGVSWHTYMSQPVMPHEVDLMGRLAAIKEAMAETGKKLPIINTETGLKFASREYIDRPMSDAQLRALKRTGGDTFPERGMTEHKGGAAFVENAIVNFLAGAEYFTIFGWNPVWSDPSATPGTVDYGWFVGAHKANRRTPGRHTLALGVLVAQMEPAIHTRGRTINQDGIQGGIFPKTNGGELAVLWSTGGARTVFVRSKNPELELVSMLGQTSTLKGRKDDESYIHTIILQQESSYIHAKKPLRKFLPSPLRSVRVESVSAGQGQIGLTIENLFPEPWQGQIAFKKEKGWQVVPAKQDFTLKPGEQVALIFKYEVDLNVPKGRYSQALEISLPGGTQYFSAVTIPVSPIFRIPVLPEECSVAKLQAWQPPGGPLVLNQTDQVVLGKPSDLASLQEQGTWAGPAELSAEAKIGYDEEGLSVYVKVHDAHPGLPKAWPGVMGSCLEFFFDFRPENKGLGNPNYGSDAHQIVVRPVIKQGQKPGVWHPSASSSPLPNLSVEAGYLDAENYWVALRIPWSDIGKSLQPGMRMGFDVGVNGPPRNRNGRKTQIMMFGGSSNCVDASLFGVGILGDSPGKGDL